MNQKRLWDYYQGEALDSFDGSVVRLRALIKLAIHLPGPRQRSILNIGTGNGWLERACVQHGWQAISLDPSKIAIEGLVNDDLSGAVGLIETLPVRSNSLDIVFCSEVLEHLLDDQLSTGLREIARSLRPGGYLIGSVPFNENLLSSRTICPECGTVFHRWGHHQAYDQSRIAGLLKAAELQPRQVMVRAFPYFAKSSVANTIKSQIVKTAGRLGFQSLSPTMIFVAQKQQRS